MYAHCFPRFLKTLVAKVVLATILLQHRVSCSALHSCTFTVDLTALLPWLKPSPVPNQHQHLYLVLQLRAPSILFSMPHLRLQCLAYLLRAKQREKFPPEESLGPLFSRDIHDIYTPRSLKQFPFL